MLPDFQVLHGDATDVSFLRAERLHEAKAFVALTGHDEGNLMASLLAQEMGIDKVIALVDRSETSHLWRRLGLMNIVSPRLLAARRIQDYITSGFSSNIVSLEKGKAQVFERRLVAASPAAGVTLGEIKPPRGVIVGAVARGDKVFVPRGEDRLEIGDLVILFVQEEHVPMVHLLFPGKSSDESFG
jgi:trk system potassium uptake protein TrkA